MKNLFIAQIILCLGPTYASAQKDIADIASKDLKADKDERKRYFLIGPHQEARPPENGWGLVVIMPGGSGSADMLAFGKRIFKHAIPKDCLAVQLAAVKWTPQQRIVWPTAMSPVAQMKFTTESYVVSVVMEVVKNHKVNRNRVYTLSWSSSGPAAYAISLQEKKLVTGSFIAMSVYKPDRLPPLKRAKGHRYFLLHSPTDRICPFRFAEAAHTQLGKHGARVELRQYQGGHGWRGNVYGNLRAGFDWLDKNQE